VTRRRSLRVAIGVALCSSLSLVGAAPANHEPFLLQHSSIGPSGGNGPNAVVDFYAPEDGSRVWFRTAESLVPEDTDTLTDLYERRSGNTQLLSTGPSDDGTATAQSFLGHASPDGTHVYFTSLDKLTPDATEGASNLYDRAGPAITLIPTSWGGEFAGASDDGGRVFVVSSPPLTAEDTDAGRDIFEWSAGSFKLISTGPASTGTSTHHAEYVDTSADGTRVFFQTREALVAADTDNGYDVYERSGGVTKLLSIGPAGGNAAIRVFPLAVRGDGDHVFFRTHEPLVAEDTDTVTDIYEHANGTTSIISDGPAPDSQQTAAFGGAPADGERAYVLTPEQLVAEDTDAVADVYEHSGGVTRLIDTGPALVGGNGSFVGFSEAGDRLIFSTVAQMTAADTDAQLDVYALEDGVWSLLSTGPTGGNGNDLNDGAFSFAESADARRVFFRTAESLVPADQDSHVDLYESVSGATYLISIGPAGGNGAFDVDCCSTQVADDGSIVYFETADQLTASDTDSVVDVYGAVVPAGEHVRPKGASPFRVSLVPAFEACTAANREHGPALAFGSCAPPQPASPNLTVGVGDGSPAFARSIGSVRFAVLPGVPGAPDDADVRIRFSLSNVMRASDLSEYTGELRTHTQVRLTDRDEAHVSQTVEDFPLAFDVPCTPTAEAADKSLCELVTTVDTLVPGAAGETTRAVWAVDQVRVYDGGPDEDASTTADNTVFAVQGVFVP
jgi:hypothetical protein